MTNVLTRRRGADAVFRRIEEATGLPERSLNLLGLDLTDPDLPYDRWIGLGQGLGTLHRWTAFALGDWLNFGVLNYGEEQAYAAVEGAEADRYNVATRTTGLAAQTLMNYSSVCSRVPRSRRRPELSFSAHEAVAKLEADEQTEWLQRAVDNGWGRDEIRAELRAARNGGVLPPAVGGGLERMTTCEQIQYAARQLHQQAQPTGDGDYTVPAEAYALLGAALDETDDD